MVAPDVHPGDLAHVHTGFVSQKAGGPVLVEAGHGKPIFRLDPRCMTSGD